MKTTRQDEFSTSSSDQSLTPAKKRARIKPNTTAEIIKHTGQMLDMPDEIWLMVLKKLNKKELRKLAETNSFFHNLIAGDNLVNKAPWPSIDYTEFLKTISLTQKGNSIKAGLQNGDLVIGGEKGDVHVLKLRQNEWQTFCKQSSNKDASAVNDAILLSSGHILTCGDEGLKIWDRQTQKLIQHLQVGSFGTNQLKRVIELKSGDLVTKSKSDHIHIWKKNQYTKLFHIQPDLLLFVPAEKIKQFFVINNLLLIQDSSNISFVCLPLASHKDDDVINPLGPPVITPNDIKRAKIVDIKHRMIQAITNLMKDEVFTSTYTSEKYRNYINQLLADPSSAKVTTDPYRTPKKLLHDGYLIVSLGRLRFMVNLFNPNITPYLLGIQGFQHHIGCIDEQLIIICGRANIPVNGIKTDGIEILSDWDSATNKFNRSISISSLSSSILKDGSVLARPTINELFVYNVQENITRELPINISNGTLVLNNLNNNDLIGGEPNIDGKGLNLFKIWNKQTGKVNFSLKSKSDSYDELANGDLITCEQDNDTSQIEVRRFKTQK